MNHLIRNFYQYSSTASAACSSMYMRDILRQMESCGLQTSMFLQHLSNRISRNSRWKFAGTKTEAYLSMIWGNGNSRIVLKNLFVSYIILYRITYMSWHVYRHVYYLRHHDVEKWQDVQRFSYKIGILGLIDNANVLAVQSVSCLVTSYLPLATAMLRPIGIASRIKSNFS